MSISILDQWIAIQCNAQHDSLLAQLRKVQETRLQNIVTYACKHSRLYRKRLAHIEGHALSLETLSSLPFTTAEDIRQWQDLLCISQDAVARMVSIESSGTSGFPKRLAFSQNDLEATKTFFRIGMSQLVPPKGRVLSLWPGAQRPNSVSALLRDALAMDGSTVFFGNPQANQQSLCQELAQYNPHVIVAAPRQLAIVHELLSNKTWQGSINLALQGILTSAEPMSLTLAQALQTQHGLVVLEHYGMTEMGYGGGVECAAHDGYHLRKLDLLVEIVDMATGTLVPDGQEGEIVITTLMREAMPLIRYRTGDVASFLPGSCRCGSPLRRLSRIRGRIVRHGESVSVTHVAKGNFCERPVPVSL